MWTGTLREGFYILEYFFNMCSPEMGLLCQKV